MAARISLIGVGVLFSAVMLPSSASFGASQPGFCAAVRGNGHFIMAHWASLARIVEDYGIPRGMAGGSSASITAFLYESMLLNPDWGTYIDSSGMRQDFSEDEKRQRLAILLKSLRGYIKFLATNNKLEADAVQGFHRLRYQLAKTLRPTYELERADVLEAGRRLQETFNEHVSASLINHDVVGLLVPREGESLTPEVVERIRFHYHEIKDGVMNLTSFAPNSTKIFIRPTVIHFDQLAVMLGRVANFYAGRGFTESDGARYRKMLAVCSQTRRRGLWKEQSGVCHDAYHDLIKGYFEHRDNPMGDEPTFEDRVAETVGARQEFFPVVSTSVLLDPAAELFVEARQNFLRGDKRYAETFQVTDFQAIGFGYWSSPENLDRIAQGLQPFIAAGDLKSEKFEILPSASWRQALRLSPAEPGLSPIRDTQADSGPQFSAGGWSDLAPTLVLRALGCDNIIYITRRNPESSFATGVTELLGADRAEMDVLYGIDLDQSQESSLERSMSEADAIWCTDWDSEAYTRPELDLEAMAASAYQNASVIINETKLKNRIAGVGNGIRKNTIEGFYLRADLEAARAQVSTKPRCVE